MYGALSIIDLEEAEVLIALVEREETNQIILCGLFPILDLPRSPLERHGHTESGQKCIDNVIKNACFAPPAFQPPTFNL